MSHESEKKRLGDDLKRSLQNWNQLYSALYFLLSSYMYLMYYCTVCCKKYRSFNNLPGSIMKIYITSYTKNSEKMAVSASFNTLHAVDAPRKVILWHLSTTISKKFNIACFVFSQKITFHTISRPNCWSTKQWISNH